MCLMYNESDGIITKDGKGANDGIRKVGQDIFEWMYALRCGIDSLAT